MKHKSVAQPWAIMKKSIASLCTAWNLIFVAWLVAFSSLLTNLFFSEVMQFPPCVLCWYQRICMYPLVLILLRGLFPFDSKVVKYALPLVLVGWLISLYQNLLYYKILPESAAPCRDGVSCAQDALEAFGFITIPLLSFVAFGVLALLLFWVSRKARHEK